MTDWTGNKRSVWATLGASSHSKTEREKNDFYATDPIAVDKLVAKYDLPHRIWEPACGTGCLSKRLTELGHDVYSSDLVDRGFGDVGVNFFEQMVSPVEGDYAIVTNPPYKYVTEFVLHSLELSKTVILFLKTTTLESRGRYDKIFRNYPPPICLPVYRQGSLCEERGFRRRKEESRQRCAVVRMVCMGERF